MMNIETETEPTKLTSCARIAAQDGIVLHEYAGCTNIVIIEGSHFLRARTATPKRGPVARIADEVARTCCATVWARAAGSRHGPGASHGRGHPAGAGRSRRRQVAMSNDISPSALHP
jgi:hypothetical protein